MSTTRRDVIAGAGIMLLAGLSHIRLAAATSPAVAFLDKSQLIYLSPLLTDGSESKCHGEVWFVYHDGEVFVVTKSDAWRTQAIRRGLRRAAIWIGEFGPWGSAKDRYRSAPYLVIEGQIESDATTHDTVLAVYATKYPDEWNTWGPRFRDGLRSGDRVMLRYAVPS
jgi:hypothetical protein